MGRKKIVAISIAFSLYTTFSYAEEIKLEQITIKKDQFAPADYFLNQDLESLPFFSLEEFCDYSSGVEVKERASGGVQQDISLRGSIFEDTAVAVGGVEVNDPQTGHFNLELPFTSADLERIELQKNSQRINFVPKAPQSKGGVLKTTFGQHALREQLLSYNFATGEINNRISAEHKISKGARLDTDFEVYNFSLHSLWEKPQKKIELLFGSTLRDFGADSFYSSAFPHEEEHLTQRFISLLAGLKKEQFSLESTLYLRRHTDKYILNRHDPSFYTNYHTSYVYGLKNEISLFNDLFLELEAEREHIDSTNLSKRYRLKKRLGAGIREKKWHNFFIEGQAGISDYEQWEYLEDGHFSTGYFFQDNLKGSFSFDRIWRAPSFTELYYRSPSNRGNTSLKVQKSNNYEWGLDYFYNQALRCSLSYFRRNQDNTIDWVKDIPPEAWQAENVGDIEVAGCDVYVQLDVQENILNTLSLGYTYLDLQTANPYNFSKYVFDYNRHKIVGIIRLDILGTTLNIVENFSYPVNREGYTTFDLKIEKKFADFTLAVEGINLGDKYYQELQDISAPGRWIKASVAYSF